MSTTPIFKIVRRTWFERLCTFPWRPLRATRQVRDWKAEFARPDHRVRPAPPPAPARYERTIPVPQRHGEAPRRGQADGPGASFDGWPVTGSAAPFFPSSDPSPSPAPFRSGGGGDFGGGGASGSWGGGSDSSSSASSDSSSSSSSSDSSSSSSSD